MNKKQSMPIQRLFSILLIFSLFIQPFPEYLFVYAEETTTKSITMTEFYENESLDSSILEDTIVTINSLEELNLFRSCCAQNGGLRTWGITFQQTKDISYSDVQFVYKRQDNRIGIYRGEALLGAIHRQGTFLKNLESTEDITLDSLDIEDSLLDTSAAMNFYGTYDGLNNVISGFAMLSDSKHTSFFGELSSSGIIKNLAFKNIFWLSTNGSCIVDRNYGTIENCAIINSCGMEKKSDTSGKLGNISIENHGTITDCKIDSCTLILNSNETILGGITAWNTSFVRDCDITSSLLMGYFRDWTTKKEYAGILGGIVGLQTKGNCDVSSCYSFCELDRGVYSGGIIGKIIDCDSTMGEIFRVYDCRSSHSITCGKYLDNSRVEYSGGIVGYVQRTNKNCPIMIQIENCITTANMYTYADLPITAYTGGILGYSESEITIYNCINNASFEKLGNKITSGSWGGIAGKLKTGTIVNCSNYSFLSNSSYESDTSYHVTGGILGIGETANVTVENCLSAGNLSGYYCGGIVGQYLSDSVQSENITDIPVTLGNCVSLGEVSGTFSGTLAGDAGNTSAYYCYSQKWENVPMLTNGTTQSCEFVMETQIKGTELYQFISPNSTSYAYTGSLKTALNNWVSHYNSDKKKYYYYAWSDNSLGYPTLNSSLVAAPTTITYSQTLILPGDSSGQTSDNTPEATPALDTILKNPPGTTSTPSSIDDSKKQNTNIPELSVKKFKIIYAAANKVKLSWKSNPKAEGYIIFRSLKKKGGYRQIASAKSSSTSYLDQKVSSGKIYYYKIQAYTMKDAILHTGKSVKIKANVKWYRRPDIQLRLTADKGQKYMQVKWKNAKGTHFEIYLRKNKKKYVKVPLRNNKLSAYSGKVRFTYNWKKTLIYCKIRTYKIVHGKKHYSEYSTQKKIRLN